MGLFDWFRKRRKGKIEEEKQVMKPRRTGELPTEMEKPGEKELKKRRRKKKGCLY